MTLKKSTTKTRRTPLKSRTPVIAGRVPESLHRLIKKAAEKSGRSMSDELAFRAMQSFAWEKAHGTARKLIDNAYRITMGTLRQAMVDAGYTAVHGSGGTLWAEPQSKISEAARQELAKMLKEREP
jgi:uncharacterized protein (DUF1778 family)